MMCLETILVLMWVILMLWIIKKEKEEENRLLKEEYDRLRKENIQ